MNKKEEIKKLLFFGKKIFDKKTLKKFKNIEDVDEKIEALKYLLKSKLNLKYEHLKTETIHKKKQNKDVFFAETKLNILKPKIKLFEATWHKKDFDSILKLIRDIENELKDI